MEAEVLGSERARERIGQSPISRPMERIGPGAKRLGTILDSMIIIILLKQANDAQVRIGLQRINNADWPL